MPYNRLPLPVQHSRPRCWSRFKSWASLAIATGGLLSCLVLWARGQATHEQDSSISAASRAEERQLSALAVLHPVEVANEIALQKTPEELEEEQASLAAVLDPVHVAKAYEAVHGEEFKQKQALARLAITDPQKYAEMMGDQDVNLPPAKDATHPQVLSTRPPIPEPPPLAQ